MRWPYPRIPALGRNLPRVFSEDEITFTERLRTQFPIGSDEGAMIKELKRQGFIVDQLPFFDGWRSASVRWGIVVQTLWSVRWRSTEGQIDEVFGVYGAISP